MAVEIELELDASSALGEIGAISLALENLDKKFDDLADFDLELGDIGGEIRDLVDALEDVDVNLNNIADRIEKAAADLDGAEVSVSTPDGTTGDGDSSGNDPPVNVTTRINNLGDAAQTDVMSDGGGGSLLSPRRSNERLMDLFGVDADGLIGPEFENWQGNNFAPWAKGRTMHTSEDDRRGRFTNIRDAAYTDVGLGTEPLTMSDKRLREANSYQELADFHGLDLDLGGNDRGGFRNLVNSKAMDGADDAMESAQNAMGKLGKRLKKLKPSMGKYMQLLAAAVPVMIAFGTQAAGVAVALGGVAVAGAAVMGLGLLGHADSMAGSFQQAKMEVREFKSELFDVFQPTMQQFAPMQAQFFDWAPDQLQGVAEAMEGLSAYEGTFYDIFSIGTDSLEELVTMLVRNEAIVSEMATSAASLIGSGLVDFFRWLLQTAYENWQLMTQLGRVFMDFITIAYNVSMVVARIVAALEPMFALIAGLTQFMNSPLISGIMTAVTTFGILAFMLWKVTYAFYAATTAMATFGSGGLISGLIGAITTIGAHVVALTMDLFGLSFAAATAVAALSALTLGAFAIGAGVAAAGSMSASGPSGGGMPGGGPGGKTVVYEDNRQYSFQQTGGDYASEQKTLDVVKEHNGTVSEMQPPEPGTNSSSSTTGSGNGGNGSGSNSS